MSKVCNDYKVGDSPGYALFSILLHGGAGLMLLLTDALTAFSVSGIALIALAWVALGSAAIDDLRRRGICRGPDAIVHIKIDNPHGAHADGRWRLGQRSGEWFGPAMVIGGRVMGRAIWLHLRDQSGRRQTICVPADSMSGRMFRRLRVAANAALGQ